MMLWAGARAVDAQRTLTGAEQRRAAARRFLAARGLTAHSAVPMTDIAHAMARARGAKRPLPLDSSPIFNLSAPWTPLGPTQTLTTAYGAVTGRVSSLAIDGGDASGNTVFLGTTGGGVWKSTNAAGPSAQVSFAPITDLAPSSSTGLGSLSIGAVSVQSGTSVVLAGTGDPNDALDSYYGQGILRSIDHGVTWMAIDESSDNLFSAAEPHSFVGEGFAGFAWSTVSPNLVVAAVTQALDGVIVNALQSNSFEGLYYSIDAGATWRVATITDAPGFTVQGPASPLGTGYIGNAATAVVWNPFRQLFFAAVQYHGYYSSPDGVTWTRVSGQPGLGLSLANCPTRPNQQGDALSCPMVRGALAVQPKTGDMFAFTVAPFNSLEQGNPDQGIWRDVCSANGNGCSTGMANMFSQQLPATPLENGSGAISNGDYSLWLAAVPAGGGSTDTLLYAGTDDIFKYSLLGGGLWQNMTNVNICPVASIAPYQHAVAAASIAGPMMFFGNDSGVWRTTDGIQQQSLCVADLQNLNSGLGSLAEISSIAADPGRSGTLLAAQGVNGASATSNAVAGAPAAWPQVLDGYGSSVAVDPENPMNWYAAGAGVSIYLCGSGGACDPDLFPYAPIIGDAQTSSDGETLLNPAVWILDPQDSTRMIVGTCRVWRGSVAGAVANWSSSNALSPVLNEPTNPGCNGESQISALGASGAISISGVATSREVLYAGMDSTDRDGIFLGGGTVAGHVFTQTLDASTTGPTAWTDISQYPSIVVNGITNQQTFNPGGFTVSSVVVDTHDSSGQTVYATIQGIAGNGINQPTVYRSSNQGLTWINETSNLLEVPVNGLVVDPGDADIVYVATDLGVFVATDITSCANPTASCWSPFGTRLPDAPVTTIAAWGTGTAGLLRAGTYGRGVWQTALVSEQPLTKVQATPTTLTFPDQQEQTPSLPQSVTITNTGTAALMVDGFRFSQDAEGNTDFSETDTCGSTVPVAGSCVVTVLFDPTTTGPLNAVLTMSANLPAGQAQIFLSGVGTLTNVRLNPPSLTFGQTAIATTSPAQNIVVENMGTSAVPLGSPSATGAYQIAGNTCTSTVQPQNSCTVGIVFTPMVNGKTGGTFSIVAGAVTLTASLSGTGLSPATDTLTGASNGQLQFAPQLVGTASPAQTVVITNTGGTSLTGISATSTSGDFIVSSGCYTVVGHSNCAVLVSFAPTVAGSRTGTLTIADVLHIGANAQTIALVGTGVARAGVASVGPAVMDFGIEGVGSISSPQMATLTNNGTAALTGLLFSATGSFQVSPGNCGSSLAPGGVCQPGVTFTPATEGPLTGILTVTGSNQTFTTALSGEGISFSLATAVGLLPVSGASIETVVSGAPATYQVNVLPVGNSTGTLALSCSGAPSGYTCTASGGSVPGVMQLQSGQQSSVTIVILPVASASNRSGGLRPDRTRFRDAGLLTVAFVIPVWAVPKKRRALSRARARCWSLSLAAVLLLCGLAGCAFTTKSTGGSTGGGSGTGVSTGVSDTVTLTVSAPGIQKTATLSLIVEK